MATPDIVTLVAMGEKGRERADEDEICALHLRTLLEGRAGNREAVRDFLLAGKRVADFENPPVEHLHPGDLEIALDVDRYGFAIAVATEDGRPVARRAG
jgi:2-phosphosulfolactate phosphatase